VGTRVDVTIHTGSPPGSASECVVRIAAAGDVHFGREGDRERAAAAFGGLEGRVDLVLLAGDLTTHGEPEQAAIVAEAAGALDVPVLTVLGNHDWHSNRADEVRAVLEEAGIVVLERSLGEAGTGAPERSHRVLELCGAEIGVVGTKGFVGGFAGSHIPDFGEPLLRRVYAEGVAEVAAVDEGLRAVAMCPFRIVLLHYSPTAQTLEGERRDIWTFLGTDRLAAPILEHNPDLVLHGHAHAGTFEGRVGEVPVYNVSVPVMGEDFWVFEMTGARRAPSEVH
jgi:Icc-related predicted phosphoesterase